MTEPKLVDLGAIARDHRSTEVVLDLEADEVVLALSTGDILDISQVLEVDPAELVERMAKATDRAKLEVGLAIAWAIGRKTDPSLTFEEVRSSWRVVPPGKGTPKDPPGAARRSTARHSSSGSPA